MFRLNALRLKSSTAQIFSFSRRSFSKAKEVEPADILSDHLKQRFIKGKLSQKESAKTLTNKLDNPTVRFRSIAMWSTVFGSFFVWAVYYGRSIQIKNSPLFKGVLFTLRQDNQVKKYVGKEFDIGTSNWIKGLVLGHVNHVKGQAELKFDIEGKEGKGSVELKAFRKKHDWFVEKMIVVVAGEEIVHMEHGQPI
ncbi:hypothetical protein MP638_004197 [Amoeboaphelidium occidentale]|nr:hypothetical protein MP638_004197 [Amoeboaphelidium occidentale]